MIENKQKQTDANKIIEHEIDYRYYISNEDDSYIQNENHWVSINETQVQKADKRFELIFSNFTLLDHNLNVV